MRMAWTGRGEPVQQVAPAAAVGPADSLAAAAGLAARPRPTAVLVSAPPAAPVERPSRVRKPDWPANRPASRPRRSFSRRLLAALGAEVQQECRARVAHAPAGESASAAGAAAEGEVRCSCRLPAV